MNRARYELQTTLEIVGAVKNTKYRRLQRTVIGLILRETAVVLAAGLGTGTLMTLAVGRAAATLLFGLAPYDPLTLLIAGISLSVLAGAASFLPAWRAASLNPVIALRQE